ncbi:tetratricopeptide repeat protein [Cellulophaga sp. HaHaR_3_176]|uniref:tetratricopeptide repeat-containing sensor histidine kinase n=1 Tax=Cellulophaga sp. HaHaR_3_176 TaxID=1942464 RepID=UPI001C1FA384|nr:tetratricopeptide repeat protein [Cellulophaga sp. HaHaR_3_176]QWX85188.1 tetratricopeptide repeat protein [Cellulophaga sp. HaHaR_3_176]
MARFIFSKKYFYFVFLLVFICCPKLQGQVGKSTLTKISELKSHSDFNPQNSNYIDLLLDLAETNMRANPDSTAILLKESYDLSVASEYKKGESIALSTYGYFYAERGDTNKADEYNKKALDIANAYNLDNAKITALNNMGIDFHFQGDHANALTKYLEALTVAEKVNDTRMMSVLSTNIAFLYSYNDDFETALIFHKKSRQINIDAKNEDLLIVSTLSIAHIYRQIGDLEESERLFNDGIPIIKKQNRKDWLSSAYMGKGKIGLERKNYQESLMWFIESEKLCDEIDYSNGYTGTYQGLAESYLGLENLELAETYALKALQISKQISLSKAIKESNLILSNIYHKKGEDKKAFSYMNEYRLLYEKEADEKFKKGLGVALSKMKFENQKKQLIDDQSKVIAKQKSYVYLAIAALLIVSLFLIQIYRTNKLQLKHTEELEEKQNILLQHEAELSEANETKDKLFSIIAHDLKGPINSFYALLELSLTGSMTKEDYNILLPKALKNIQGISVMLNNLLEWAKTQMNGIVVEQRQLEINSVLENTIKVLSPLAEKKLISINNLVPNTNCFSDKNHLTIILRNLISNAIKFTNTNGIITINASIKNNFLEIAIADNGIGMSPEKLQMLFKSAHMKSSFGTDNEKGTGLGLFLCKEMAEGNGGELWVTSEENVGTTIYFTVPMSNKV